MRKKMRQLLMGSHSDGTLWWMVVAPFRCRSEFWSRATAIASLVDVGFYSRRISVCGQLNIANRLSESHYSGLVKDLMHKGHCGNFEFCHLNRHGQKTLSTPITLL